MSSDIEDIPNWTFYDFPDHMISHRDSFVNMVCESKSAYFYGKVRVTVVKLPDQNWWIVPYFNDEDHLMEDKGPYKTATEAVMITKLITEKR